MASILTLWKYKEDVCCTARDDMVILFPHKCPMSLPFFLMAAVPLNTIKEGTFQRQVLIFNSAFESTADSQVLPMTSQTQWVQPHLYFDAPAEVESPMMGSALSTGAATFQNWVPPVNLRLKVLPCWRFLSAQGPCTKHKSATKLVQKAKV